METDDLLCPVCLQMLRDPYLTSCGHSFCHDCIVSQFRDAPTTSCPRCGEALTRKDVLPNKLLSVVLNGDALLKVQARMGAVDISRSTGSAHKVALRSVEQLLKELQDKKRRLEQESEQADLEVVYEFLLHVKGIIGQRVNKLSDQLALVEADLVTTRQALSDFSGLIGSGGSEPSSASRASDAAEPSCPGAGPMDEGPGHGGEPARQRDGAPPPAPPAAHPQPQDPQDLSQQQQADPDFGALSTRIAMLGMAATRWDPSSASGLGAHQPFKVLRQRVLAALPDLQALYFEARVASGAGAGAGPGSADGGGGGAGSHRGSLNGGSRRESNASRGGRSSGGQSFDQPPPQQVPAAPSAGPAAAAAAQGGSVGAAGILSMLSTTSQLVQHSRLRVLSEISKDDLYLSDSIVSSIEFDCGFVNFATAGVSKRIKIYNCNKALEDPATGLKSILQIGTRSKLSCLSWHKRQRNFLASSDYDGVVSLWDTNTAKRIVDYEEHERRVWCIDFSADEPDLLVSGSDDGLVKLWSVQRPTSLLELNIKANVCCVRFCPGANRIVVGSADHNVQCFDIRRPKDPIFCFSGHQKAVSNIRFLSPTELVSASTDNSLNLWDTRDPPNEFRRFCGHVNEKNFVGLATSSNFIACGSETNEVFVYHKHISKPAAHISFAKPGDVVGEGTAQFVSAVCWRDMEGEILLAGNSEGLLKVFTTE